MKTPMKNIDNYIKERHFGPIWFLPGDNRATIPYCNSVYVEGPGILFDPSQNRERLLQLKKDPGVNELWFTHWHHDHTTFWYLFNNLPFRISKKDMPPVRDRETAYDWYRADTPSAREIWRNRLENIYRYRPRQTKKFFEDSQVFEFDNITIETIPAPGHTPGHTAFFFREPRILYLADYDLSTFGPYYADLNSDIDELIASVNRPRQVPADIWITSHGQGVFDSNPDKLWDRYLDVILQRDSKLFDYLSKPRTMMDIIHQWITFKQPREPLSYYEFEEGAIMRKHLERMISKGRIHFDGTRYARV